MRISDWSSDVCSSDLTQVEIVGRKSAKARELLAHPCRIAHGPIDFETRHRHADRVRPRRTIGHEDRESVARRPLANGDARLEDDTAIVPGVATQHAIAITLALGEKVGSGGCQSPTTNAR